MRKYFPMEKSSHNQLSLLYEIDFNYLSGYTMHMGIFSPYQSLAFPNSQCLGVHFQKKASVYGSQHTHSVLLWPVLSS